MLTIPVFYSIPFKNTPQPVLREISLFLNLNTVYIVYINLQSENVGKPPTFTDTVSHTTHSAIIVVFVDKLTGYFIRYTFLVLVWAHLFLQNDLNLSWDRLNKFLETFL